MGLLFIMDSLGSTLGGLKSVYTSTLDNTFLGLLFLVSFVDFVIGTVKARKYHVLDSSVGWVGIKKHLSIFLIFAFVYPFANLLSISYFIDAYALAYIYNYGNSIVENLTILGVVVPSKVQTRVLQEIERYERNMANYGLNDSMSKKDVKDVIANVSEEGRLQGEQERIDRLETYLDDEEFDWSDIDDSKR